MEGSLEGSGVGRIEERDCIADWIFSWFAAVAAAAVVVVSSSDMLWLLLCVRGERRE